MLHYSPLMSALAVLPLSCAVFVVANYFASLLLPFRPAPPADRRFVIVALGIASLSLTSLDGAYWYQMLPDVVAMGLGMGVAFPAMTAAGLTGIPSEQHGVAGAVNVVAQQIGASVGLVLLVVVAATTTTTGDHAGRLVGYHTAYLTAAALAILCVVVIALGKKWESRSAKGEVVAEPAQTDGTA